MVPSYISDIIPPTVANVSRYELRNSETISRITVRTSTFSKSCIPSAINEWNNLQASFRDCDSYNSFCYTLKMQSLNKILNYFFDGKRKFSILHARLHNFCSNLNQDLFDNHLRDDPICSCLRGTETADHYFFKMRALHRRKSFFVQRHAWVSSFECQHTPSRKKKLCLIMITLGFFNSFKLIYTLRADLQTSLKFLISVHRCTCMSNICSSVSTLLFIFFRSGHLEFFCNNSPPKYTPASSVAH